MNLELLVSQIQAAETPKDGEAILREAIEKWINGTQPDELYVAVIDYRFKLLASIQPKEMK